MAHSIDSHTTSYLCSIIIMTTLCIVYEIKLDIDWTSRFFHTPPLAQQPPCGTTPYLWNNPPTCGTTCGKRLRLFSCCFLHNRARSLVISGGLRDKARYWLKIAILSYPTFSITTPLWNNPPTCGKRLRLFSCCFLHNRARSLVISGGLN